MIGYQRFKAQGLQAFSRFSSAPANLTGAAMMMPGGGSERVSIYENSFGISITKQLK